jgi:hypothetical protein
MYDPRDFKLDIASVPHERQTVDPSGKPFLSILFNCCNVYQRIYPNHDFTAYAGRCPKCLRTVRFPIGAGGTSERQFVVDFR